MNTKNYKIELKKIMHEKHINGKQLAELAEISGYCAQMRAARFGKNTEINLL